MVVYLRKTCKESLTIVGLLYDSSLDVTHVWLDDEDNEQQLPPHLSEKAVPVLIDQYSTLVGEKAIWDYLIYKGL